MRRWWATLRRNWFAGQVLNLAAGTAMGQVLVVAVTPIITRLYTPGEMGVLGIFVSFVGFVGAGAGLRYEMAIVSAADDREADHLLVISLLLAMPISALAALVLLWMIHAEVWSYQVLPAWSALGAGLAIGATTSFTSLRYWVVRRKGFRGIGRALVLQGVGRATASVGWGVLSGGWIGLLFGELAGRALGIRSLLTVAWSYIRGVLFPFDGTYCASVMRRYGRFPLVMLPSSLVTAMVRMLPLPILASLLGAPAAGHFLLAQRLSCLPADFVSASVNDVLHSRVADLHQSDPRHVRRTLFGILRKLGMLSLLIYVPLAVLAPLLGERILGREWAETGVLVAILAPMFLIGLVVTPLTRVFIVVDRLELKLAIDAIQLLPAFSLFFWHARGWSFLQSMAAYSALSSVLGLVYLGVVGRLLHAAEGV